MAPFALRNVEKYGEEVAGDSTLILCGKRSSIEKMRNQEKRKRKKIKVYKKQIVDSAKEKKEEVWQGLKQRKKKRKGSGDSELWEEIDCLLKK